MEIGWNILWFLIGVSLLVTVHEFGHFWVARKLGFKVLRFSVGFGKPLWKRVGRRPTTPNTSSPRCRSAATCACSTSAMAPCRRKICRARSRSKPPWQRILVLLAGPAANILFAIVVLWGMFWSTGRRVPQAGGRRRDARFARGRGRPAQRRSSSASADESSRDRGDVVLGLLDMVSDEGSAVIDVRGRDGQVRSCDAERCRMPTQRLETHGAAALFRGLGFEFWRPPFPARLGEVIEGGPAALAGLKPGDLIVSADGTRIRNYNELADYINARPGETVSFDVRRGNSEF